MKIFSKYKNFMSDMILNMIGFGIYIVSQQILLLPILAKVVNDEVYASIVLYISILNVVCNVTGGELGNVRLVKDADYKKNNIIGDFSRILLFLSLIVVIIIFPILLYLKYSILGSMLLIITMLLANIRLYATSYYRLEQKYNRVIIQNVLYLIGIILSLIIFYLSKNIYLLLLIPEIISVGYALKYSDLLKMKLIKTKEIKNTIKKFGELGFVSLLVNLMNYIDKFLIYPILGATAVAVYYAVNSMSKIISLITNPMSNVILSWVSKVNENKKKNKIIKSTIIANIPIIIVVSIVSIPLTYLALKILYSQYLADAMILIVPISIITAFGAASTLTKSVILKFSDTKRLMFIYMGYFVLFAILAYNLSKTNGLLGFAYSNLISRIILWISFIILLITSKNTKVEEKNEIND